MKIENENSDENCYNYLRTLKKPFAVNLKSLLSNSKKKKKEKKKRKENKQMKTA